MESITELCFDTLDGLKEAVNGYAISNEFSVISKITNKRACTLVCKHGGGYKPHRAAQVDKMAADGCQEKEHEDSTKRQEPGLAIPKCVNQEHTLALMVWKRGILSDDPSRRSARGRYMPAVARRQIINGRRKDTASSDLQLQSNKRFTAKDIYSLKSRLESNDAQHDELPTIMEYFKSYNFIARYHTESATKKVKSIFVTHPRSIERARMFPECLRSFVIGTAVVADEKALSYVWILKTLGELAWPTAAESSPIFLSLTTIMVLLLQLPRFADLCNHISTMIWTRDENVFLDVIRLFNDSVSKGQPKKGGDKKQLHEYLNMLREYKKRWAGPWAEEHMHLGARSTRRIEGAHAALKMSWFTCHIARVSEQPVIEELGTDINDIEEDALELDYQELKDRIDNLFIDAQTGQQKQDLISCIRTALDQYKPIPIEDLELPTADVLWCRRLCDIEADCPKENWFDGSVDIQLAANALERPIACYTSGHGRKKSAVADIAILLPSGKRYNLLPFVMHFVNGNHWEPWIKIQQQLA
ncbi:hypothetical protein BDB00DRAFT_880534 [Zychaea mexicana]|uniref:uncharacterized protein n=1 Tax=Zychaea mexicana TaxID=64656 RepID=UPI0022FEF866|nr:uncharacterized protein BDB00DRAFT_880534 [Zychaea mexicana]KAI9467539.1 hypothetical protein BDB00DRAFT_880534 [Zychaea mexicana]